MRYNHSLCKFLNKKLKILNCVRTKDPYNNEDHLFYGGDSIVISVDISSSNYRAGWKTGVWSAECGVRSAEYRRNGVWKMWSVENKECGK